MLPLSQNPLSAVRELHICRTPSPSSTPARAMRCCGQLSHRTPTAGLNTESANFHVMYKKKPYHVRFVLKSLGLLKLVNNSFFSETTYNMKIFDRRGLILKFDTVLNQSVPILMSILSNKQITILQIANTLCQAYRIIRPSLYKRSMPVGLSHCDFSFSCQPITGVAGQTSVNQAGNIPYQSMLLWTVKYKERETSRFFVSSLRILSLSECRDLRSKYQTKLANCGLCTLRECD